MKASRSANALAGGRKPEFEGVSDHIEGEVALFDPKAGVTILRYHACLESGRLRQVDDYRLQRFFPSLGNFSLAFAFVGGALAADITPLLQAIRRQGVRHALKEDAMSNRVGRRWTLTELDKPSNTLQLYKTTPTLTKKQTQKLDSVHNAIKAMWSPSREDMKVKIKDEFGQIDFTIDDVDLRFSMFPDVNAMKGKTQLPEIHSKSNLGDMKKGQTLLSCDVMHVGKQAYLVAVMNSPVTCGGDQRSTLMTSSLGYGKAHPYVLVSLKEHSDG